MESHGAINVVMATDPRGAVPTATAIASLWRNTRRPVRSIVIIRGDPRPGFVVERETGGALEVKFRDAATLGVCDGNLPAHVTRPSLDRLAVFKRDFAPDWERALYLDWDQLPVADFSELFDMELGEALIGARIDWEVTLEEGCRCWFSSPLPEAVLPHGGQRFVVTGGCILNLAAIRESECFNRAVWAVGEGANDQIAMNVGVGEKVAAIGAKWNYLVSLEGRPHDVKAYHWTGPHKPWGGSPAWAGEWQRRRTSFAELQAGGRYCPVDLKRLPVVVITTDDATDRWQRISAKLEGEGFNNVSKVSSARDEVHWRGHLHNTLRVFSRFLEEWQPFLMLEDDAEWETGLPDQLQVPEIADAVYLGTSEWGALDWNHGYMHYATERICEGWHRIAGMLSGHAILVRSRAYLEALATVAGSCAGPFDIDMANLQSRHFVVAPSVSLFRQSDGHNDECTRHFRPNEI